MLTIYVIRFRQDKKQSEVTKRKKFMMKKKETITHQEVTILCNVSVKKREDKCFNVLYTELLGSYIDIYIYFEYG